MRKVFRVNNIMFIVVLLLAGLLFVTCADDKEAAPLVTQALNYTENPVDIPNPDRGFERGNDDGHFLVLSLHGSQDRIGPEAKQTEQNQI